MGALQLTTWRVLVTAVHPREREAVAAQLAAAGAEFMVGFSTKDPPHLVITRSVRSPKYRTLLRACPHTNVVTPEWLADSMQAGTQLGYDKYRVGPFFGLTICLSGLNAANKNALAGMIAAGGGAHSPALDKKCTHLVTNSTDSEKYRFARRENIPVVSVKWVEDSVQRNWCQDEAAYVLAGSEGTGQTGGGGGPAAAPAPLTTLMDEATNLAELVPGGSSGPLPPYVAPTATCPPSTAGAAPAPGEAPPRVPSRLQRAGSAAAPPDAAAVAAQAAAAKAAAHRAALDAQLECDDDAPMFLDSVRMRLLGCGHEETLEALALIRQGGAKRFPDWRDDLNHVVVGFELSTAEAAEALDFLSSHRACYPVTLDWLRQCVAGQRRLRPDGFLVPTSRLTQHRRRPPVLEQLEAAGRVERSTSSGLGEAPLAAGVAALAGAGDMGRSQHMAVLSGPLEGCYFTLAALRGTETEARARQLVQENGGRVFTETTVQRVTDKSKAYALCPPSLVPQQVTQLRSGCPDFKMVEDRQRFTVYWLECSLQAGAPLAANRGAPLYQPLPYPLPMPAMVDVVVCTSGYDAEVRAAIARTVVALGGAVTPDNMTRRNTHLILPEAKGKKYEHCATFGVVPVTADWLVDTVQLGRRQNEEQYRPRRPSGLPPLPAAPAAPAGPLAARLAEAAGENSRGSWAPSGAPSQIATTQMGHMQAGRTVGAPAQPQRPQLTLPPPPQHQQQAQQAADGGPAGPMGTGGRRMTLREKMRASQTARAFGGAGPSNLGGGSGGGDAAQPPTQRHGNAENEGSNSQPDADLLQLGGKLPLTTSFLQPPQQAQQAQRTSALDEVMADLDAGLRVSQQAQQAQQEQQAQQVQQQQQEAAAPEAEQRGASQHERPASAPFSVIDALFGPSPRVPDAAAAAAAREGAAAQGPAAAALSGQGHASRSAAVLAAPGGDTPGQLAAAAAPQLASRSTGRRQRSSSRLCAAAAQQAQQAPEQRPVEQPVEPPVDMQSEPAPALMAAAEPQPQPAVSALTAADVLAGSGSEPQDDVAKALDRLNDRLMGGLRAEVAPALGSQLDIIMPPPPARGRAAGAKRGAPQPAESTLSNGSGGSRGGRGAKRATLGEDGAGSGGSTGVGRPLRRSGRGRAEPVGPLPPHLEMSQQVGYADSFSTDSVVPVRPRGGGAAAAADKQALKQHLVAAAAGRATTRRGGAGPAGRPDDPLAELLT